MNRRAVEAGRGFVTIGLRNRIEAGARGVNRSLSRLNRRMRAFGAVGASVGLAVSTPIGLALKSYADFDDQMRKVRAVTQANDQDLETLTDTAKELGRTTSFTADEVAGLMVQLGRAGFDPSQIEQMTGSVLDLARATGTDAPMAAGVMATAIRQFNLDAGQASRVADTLTVAANGSFNSIETLAESLTYAGPVAADLGMSIEETAAILGTLGNVGIQGSMAGTAIRRLLMLTAAEAKRMNRIFGVEFKDAAGNARPLVDVLDEIAKATNGLGNADRAAKFNEAFGLLGITGASAISKNAAQTRQLYQDIVSGTDAAAKAHKEMESGIGGSFRRIISAAEGVKLAIGDAVEEPFEDVSGHILNALGGITSFIEKNESLVTTIAAVSAGLVVFGGGAIALGTTAAVVSMALGGLATAASLVLSPLGLGIAAAYGLTEALGVTGQVADWVKTKFGNLVSRVSQSVKGIKAAIENGDVGGAWEIATLEIELAWLELTDGIRNKWTDTTTFILNVSASLTQQIGQMFQSLGDRIDGLLDGYKSYYEKVFEFTLEVGKNAPASREAMAKLTRDVLESFKEGDGEGIVQAFKNNQARTVGDSTAGSGSYESTLGDVDKKVRDFTEGIRELGRQMEEDGERQIEENMVARSEAIEARKRRIEELRNRSRNSSQVQIDTAQAREVEEGLKDIAKTAIQRILDSISRRAEKKNDSATPVQPQNLVQSSGAGVGTGTFSAMGSLLLGLGGTTVEERIAKASEKQVSLLEQLAKHLPFSDMDAARAAVADPASLIQGGVNALFSGVFDSGQNPGLADAMSRDMELQDAIGRADQKTFEASTDDKKHKEIVKPLNQMVKYLKRPKPAVAGP